MSLSPDTTLAHYLIISNSAWGMAKYVRLQDTKLERKVAIKFVNTDRQVTEAIHTSITLLLIE